MDDIGSGDMNGCHRSVQFCPPLLHVEVCQKATSVAKPEEINHHVSKYFAGNNHVLTDFVMEAFDEPFLTKNIDSIAVTDTDVVTQHTKEELDDENLSAASHWLLPAKEFHGMWEHLIYDVGIKSQLLSYARSTLLFSDKRVNNNVISWNRVVLLHGPPGTGKTSLCKALAQKLTIHFNSRYRYGQLIEINSHSLFSKWFSESGKLVTKMFQKIQELVDDKEALVFVLIDEVESLTAARKASMQGSEPSDAIRVVNALLTQLDMIKANENVILLTTSNITGTIDLAFVDRADVKQYIGPPSAKAIYQIYLSCVQELIHADILASNTAESIFPYNTLQAMNFESNDVTHYSIWLHDLALKSVGFSGRTLRKLPFIAHALFIQSPVVTMGRFLQALELAIAKELNDRKELEKT